MLKLVSLMKRKPGLSMAEFIDAYESLRDGHRLLGERYLRPHAVRYVRRFLTPVATAAHAAVENDYDVLMEIWFPDRYTFDAVMARLAQPDIAAEIAEDEARLFDRDSIRSFFVEEYESNMD
ncbi:EthD domain-containing protein [Haliea sp. E17]|uniref:EthD domain-containing protein n=1 Tax=Haliea sp. E17 TaxID=3401576 RepID=UPI003AAB795B